MSKFKNTEELKKAYEELEREFTKKSQELAEKDRQLKYPYKNDVIEKQYEDLKDGIKFRIENNITDDWEQLYHCIDVLCEKHKARIRDIENGICKIEELEKLLNAKEKMKTQSLKGFEKLKQQLAEKDKAIENWGTMHKSVVQTCHNDSKEIERLNKQLADTEAQNKRVLEKLDIIVRSNQELEHKLAEKDDEITQRLVIQEKDYNQDKISFALEQLEKVKEFYNTTDKTVDYEYCPDGWDTAIIRDDLLLNINNQIKQLKEGK